MLGTPRRWGCWKGLATGSQIKAFGPQREMLFIHLSKLSVLKTAMNRQVGGGGGTLWSRSFKRMEGNSYGWMAFPIDRNYAKSTRRGKSNPKPRWLTGCRAFGCPVLCCGGESQEKRGKGEK